MQRSVSDIGALNSKLRPPGPGTSARTAGSSFKDQLVAIRSEDTFDTAVSPLLRSRIYHAGKTPMKFGIIQSTLRDYDPNGRIAQHVSGLDEKKAKQIYRMIWNRAGCSKLPPELAEQHFAAYVRRPKTAIEALQKADGDPVKYTAAIKAFEHRPADAGGQSPDHDKKIAATSVIRQDTLQYSMSGPSGPPPENPAGPEKEVAIETSALSGGNKTGEESQTVAMPLKPFSAFESFHNIQSTSRNGAELPVADGSIKISIEKRDIPPGLDAYERVRSGKILADGLFIKLRIYF